MIAAHIGQGCQQLFPVNATLLEQLAGGRFITLGQQRHQEVFDGDILILEPLGFVFGVNQNARQPLGNKDLARFGAWAGNTRTPIQFGFHFLFQLLWTYVHPRQQPRHQPIGLVQQ